MARIPLLDEVLELADLLRPAWDEIRDGIPDWHPRNDGETETETETETEESESETTDTETEETEDWKAHSRKHEREAKKARREAEDLRKQLAEREEAGKSEQEKALEKARQEAADAAKAEVTGAMRKRILHAEIRAQAAGKFADPDDAIRLLDLDDEDVFDDKGDVKSADLSKALDGLLERKPHLKANGHRPSGSSDAGKGKGGGLDETDPDKLAAKVPRMY